MNHVPPFETRGGDIPWLLAVVAPKEAGQALVQKLEEMVFKGKTLKHFAQPMPAEYSKDKSAEAS